MFDHDHDPADLFDDVDRDCDGDPGPDSFGLLDAELAVRDAVGQRARTDAYHRRDIVRSHLRLLRL